MNKCKTNKGCGGKGGCNGRCGCGASLSDFCEALYGIDELIHGFRSNACAYEEFAAMMAELFGELKGLGGIHGKPGIEGFAHRMQKIMLLMGRLDVPIDEDVIDHLYEAKKWIIDELYGGFPAYPAGAQNIKEILAEVNADSTRLLKSRLHLPKK